MPRIYYRAIDKSGRLVEGEINAKNDLDAGDLLAHQGTTLLSTTKTHSNTPWWQRELSIGSKEKPLPLVEVIGFFSALNTMLSSGFPLPRCLSFAAKQASGSRSRRILNSMVDMVEQGTPLSQAFQDSKAFSSRLVALVEVAEASNQIKEVSQDILSSLQREASTKNQIRQALVYPAILLLMSFFVFSLLVFFLAPTLLPVFEGSGVSAPRTLLLLNSIGSFISSWSVGILLTLVFVLSAIATIVRNRIDLFRRFALRLPVVGPFITLRQTQVFLQTVFLMSKSGASIPEALKLASSTILSVELRKDIDLTRQRLENGQSFSEALHKTAFSQDFVISFIQAGEESNRLTEMLGQCVTVLDSQIRDRTQRALNVLTPSLTLLIGAAIGILILSTIGAILELNQIAF